MYRIVCGFVERIIEANKGPDGYARVIRKLRWKVVYFQNGESGNRCQAPLVSSPCLHVRIYLVPAWHMAF